VVSSTHGVWDWLCLPKYTHATHSSTGGIIPAAKYFIQDEATLRSSSDSVSLIARGIVSHDGSQGCAG